MSEISECHGCGALISQSQVTCVRCGVRQRGAPPDVKATRRSSGLMVLPGSTPPPWTQVTPPPVMRPSVVPKKAVVSSPGLPILKAPKKFLKRLLGR